MYIIKWVKMGQNGSKWVKMSQNGSKWGTSGQNLQETGGKRGNRVKIYMIIQVAIKNQDSSSFFVCFEFSIYSEVFSDL